MLEKGKGPEEHFSSLLEKNVVSNECSRRERSQVTFLITFKDVIRKVCSRRGWTHGGILITLFVRM